MAMINVKYNCGCGYSTEEAEEAIRHSDANNHTLMVLGSIQKDKVASFFYQPTNLKEE